MSKYIGNIDFRKVKDAVGIERVLADHGIALKRSGSQLAGCCPIHQGSNPRAFVVDPAKNAWCCFGDCNRGGSVLDLVAELESVTIREAARLLIERYRLT